MKKIIYIISGRNFKKNSLGRKISEVITNWQNNHTIEVLCGGDMYNEILTKKDQNYGDATYHNQSFRKIKLLSPLIHSLSELKDIIHDRKLYAYLCKKYDEQELSLIWERSSRLHYSGYRYAKKRGIPFVLEWKDHLIDYRFSFLKPYAQWMERYKNNNADFIVVESKVLQDELVKQGILRDKILIAYNAVNPDEFKPSKEKRNSYRSLLGLNEEDVLVGYLGSYAFYHDAERLIYAAHIIKQKGLLNIKFLMVGNGKDYQLCHTLAQKIGLIDDTIIFKDGIPKEQVPEVLASIDISVLPGSTDIICPIKVFEYMAAETVTLVPGYDCNKEVISDYVDGVFFQPHNENDLAQKIISLSHNSEILKTIGINGRKTVKEKYTWGKTWGNALDTIVQLINLSH